MFGSLEKEANAFDDMVKKASTGCLRTMENDHKLVSLILPAVGQTMFTMFVILTLHKTLMKFLNESQQSKGLREIYINEIRRSLDG